MARQVVSKGFNVEVALLHCTRELMIMMIIDIILSCPVPWTTGQMLPRHRENDQTLQTKTITDVIIMTLPYTHMVLKSNICFTKLENRIILALITCKVWMFWKPVTELHWTFIVPLLALLALELEQGSYITHIKDFFHHLNCRSYHHKLILYENAI